MGTRHRAPAAHHGGVHAALTAGAWVWRKQSYLRFDCTDATVEASHLYGYATSNWTWTPREGVDATGWLPTTDVASSHEAQLAAFLDAGDRGERPPASGAESAITGRPVFRAELEPRDPFYYRLDGGGLYRPESAEVTR